MSGRLSGITILVPESRELDLFCRVLEGQGATAVRCPLVSIRDVEDVAPIEAWLKRLMAGEFEDLVLLTGEGLMRLLTHCERMGRKSEAITAISKVRTFVRGPKPVRALRQIGLSPSIVADAPTSEGLIDSMSRVDLKGHTVAVQLYPGETSELLDFLSAAGANVATVTPYRYASESDDDAVELAIRKLAAGGIDVVALTSSPQLRRLVDVANVRNLEAELHRGLTRTLIAAVGPVVAASVTAIGAKVAIQPQSFHLKPLVAAIVDFVERRRAG